MGYVQKEGFFCNFNKFGFVLQTALFFYEENINYHIFLGPTFYFFNNPKLRVPLAIGFDVFGNKASYLGIGSLISVQYSFIKSIYIGFNFGITYAFNHIYDELTRYRTEKIVVDDGTGNAVFKNRTVPVFESKSHYGNRFYFKPSLAIGLQF